jgi:hypothetical protein
MASTDVSHEPTTNWDWAHLDAGLQDADSRLLFDDPHTVNYGSFGDQHPTALQADPQDVQRESEALQKIVAQTSR